MQGAAHLSSTSETGAHRLSIEEVSRWEPEANSIFLLVVSIGPCAFTWVESVGPQACLQTGVFTVVNQVSQIRCYSIITR